MAGVAKVLWLKATLDESWQVMGDLLAGTPGPSGRRKQEFSTLAAEWFHRVPAQRRLWHLNRGVCRDARYKDRVSGVLADAWE